MINYDCSPHFTSGGVVDSYSLQNAPAWLSIDNAGLMTGSADVEAVSNVTVTAHNVDGTAVSNVFVVTATELVETVVFIAASYDPITFELKQEVLGVGGETCVHGGILSPDKDGIYHAIPANTPVFKGFREDAGKYYADDGVGVLLDPLPYLHHQPAAINTLKYSNELDIGTAPDEGWSSFGGIVLVRDQIGVTGSVTATVLTDNDTVNQVAAYQNVKNLYLNQNALSCFIKKDTDISRFPSIRLTVYGDVTEELRLMLNTTTGAAVSMYVNGEYVVNLVGDFWRVDMAILTSVTNITQIQVAIVPAEGSSWDSVSDSATGSFIVDNVMLIEGATLNDIRKVGPIITTSDPVSTTKTDYTWAAANHGDVGKYSMDVDYQEGDSLVLSMGAIDVLSVVSGELLLSDGTNTAQLPITEGEHHIKADFSGSNLILNLNGVTDTVPYDGSLGSGDISTGVDVRRLERA